MLFEQRVKQSDLPIWMFPAKFDKKGREKQGKCEMERYERDDFQWGWIATIMSANEHIPPMHMSLM